MKTKAIFLVGFLAISLMRLTAQPTYLNIESVTINPQQASPNQIINLGLSGYFSSTGISVQSISPIQIGNQIQLNFSLGMTGIGLPVIVNFDTSLLIGPLAPGLYTVTPTGSGVGCTAPPSSLNFLVTDSLPNTCMAAFSFGPDSGIWIPEVIPVAFTDLSAPSSSIISWHWDFGDGSVSSLQNPSHGYDFMGPGSYQVCLTISTADGCTDSICQTVTIGVSTCQANFSGLNITGNPFGYQFTDLSTGNPVAWSWDFGSGNTTTMQNPFYMFPGNGTFPVCLSIVTATGCSSTFCQVFLVGPPDPCAGISLFPNPTIVNTSGPGICDGSIALSPYGGTPPYFMLWSTGETGPALSQLCAGTYFLTLVDSNGCLVTDGLEVETTVNPCDTSDVIISFLITDASTPSANDGSIELTLGGTPPYDIHWGGDVTYNMEQMASGSYFISISDANGCSDTLSFSVAYPTAIVSEPGTDPVYLLFRPEERAIWIFCKTHACQPDQIAFTTMAGNRIAVPLAGASGGRSPMVIPLPHSLAGPTLVTVRCGKALFTRLLVIP